MATHTATLPQHSDPAASTPPAGRPDLGDLLVAEGVISVRQLEMARELVRNGSAGTRLTRVLIDERMTSEQRIRDAVKGHATHYRIGDLLVLLDLITPEQLDDCLAEQRRRPGVRLGAIVLERRFVIERQLLQALSYQFEVPYIEPDIRLADIDLMRRMSVAYLRRLEAVPVPSNGKVVTIVTTDPTRKEIAAELRALLRMPVELAIGPRDAILRTLDDFEGQFRTARTTPAAGGTQGPADGNAVAAVDHLLRMAIEQHASDVHIEPMSNRIRVRFRIDGELVHRTDLPLVLGPQISSRIKVLCKADLAERRRHQDGRMMFTTGNVTVDMRVSVYVTIHGENIVIRILNQTHGILPMEKLGMLPVLLQKYKESVLDVPTGVVLFTGPTGSGKTTSLYSSIHYCNETGVKIITVEDPVEYVVDGIIQCTIDTAAGRDFPSTLREVVRQDPDVIVVGEIRDRATASVAIEAALTGHKVFATFHTEDSIGSLVRLIDMNIEAFLICSTVVSAVAQRLARRICPDCRTEVPATPYETRLLGLSADEAARHTFYRGRGCESCAGTGYRGRIGLYEMLFLDGPIRDMVLTKRPAYEIRRHALEALGLCTLQEDGIAKALLGLTTLEEVIWHVPRSSEQRPLDEISRLAHTTV
ncbi:MAG: Flp pilus assembly complex ATPase component TadA [Acidobacteria bacterium]|nr:Flp pilus assembly complex ATPase component TadA [Acidobacteriota bacterium]